MPTVDDTPLTPQQFNSYFAKVRRAQRENRAHGEHLLSPDTIRKYLRNKQPLPEQFGTKVDGTRITHDDLKAFMAAKKAAETNWDAHNRGAPVAQLIANSLPIDIQRANTEIRAAMLRSVAGNLLSFAVTASEQSKHQYHNVRVRLESWNTHMTAPMSYLSSARKACAGAVSIDCTCGRHQFWYRYQAVIGGYAVAPPTEKDFPKVRNPKLRGACCKHVLKTLASLKSPTVHSLLAKQMEKQAKAPGYASKRTQNLTKQDAERAARAKPRTIDQEEARKAYDAYVRAHEAFKTKRGGASKKTMDELMQAARTATAKAKAKEAMARKREKEAVAREKQAAEAMAQVQRDTLKLKMRASLDMAVQFDIPRKAAIEKFAAGNGISVEDATKLAEDL